MNRTVFRHVMPFNLVDKTPFKRNVLPSPSRTLKTKVRCSSDMLAPTYQTTSCHMHFLTEKAVKIADADTHSCDVTRSRWC